MTTKKKQNIVKQSLLIGALTSSFGVFISKLLGLLYYSPLSAIAGESNMVFYSVTYTYYDLLLKISQAGIPFAIAALVAKYVSREDYKSALVVKKLGTSIVMGIAFLSGLIFIFSSGAIARQSMGALASVKDVQQLQNLFMILMIAVILVPYLSVIRAYYQGLKRLDLYASSQVLEQFVRVFLIIVCGFIFVKLLKFESIWAIYMAIAAAGIAAGVSIIFFKISTKHDEKRISILVKKQESDAIAKKEIFKEIISLGIPYLLISILGTSGPLINTTFFLSYVTSAGSMSQQDAQLALGILQANCQKLNAIPQVLTSGFCAGLVPYLTESYERQDFEKLDKQIIQLIDTVLYILIPVLMIFFFFAKDIYFIMYGNKNLALGASLFRQSNLYAFTETVLPILSSIMITLRFKKESVSTLCITFLIKTVTFFIFVKYFNAYGMILSTCVASAYGISRYIYVLKKSFNIKFKGTIKKASLVFACSLISIAPTMLLHYLTHFSFDSRLMCIFLMGGLGLIILLLYFETTRFCRLPQRIFGIKNPSLRSLYKRILSRSK